MPVIISGTPVGDSNPLTAEKSLTLNASGETVEENIFTVTGIVKILKISGQVTTQLSSSVDSCGFSFSGGTALALSDTMGGPDISAYPVNSLIMKDGDSSVGLASESGADNYLKEDADFAAFVIGEDDQTISYLRFNYNTTDEPASGVIKFTVEYEAVSSDGAIAAV